MTGWKAPGRSTVSTFVVVPEAQRVIDFAIEVFGAAYVREPLLRSDGTLWNAELKIGDSTIMVSEGDGDWQQTAFVYVHVPNCDATYRRAIAAGAEPVKVPEDQFYGDRDGGVRDRAGNVWWIATHLTDLSAEEIEHGARALERRRSTEAKKT